MLYRFLHLIFRYWMKIHFKRIFIQSLQHVPRKGAAILACNHPNSFLDAIAVALVLRRDIHFLVRSDVFRKPLAAAILKRLNMIPIYRLEEGSENLERNKGTFELCNSIFEKGGMILIFSEGNCVVEKRLRTLRKGTARIWFGAMEHGEWKNPIPVIPVGINYTHPYNFRSELLLNFGKPCVLNDLKSVWEYEPARAIRMFNDILYEAMQHELLLIPDSSDDEGAEVLLDFGRSENQYPLFKAWFSEHNRFRLEKQSLERLFNNELSKKITHDAENTGKAIQKMEIRLTHFEKPVPPWQSIFLILGFIPAAISCFVHVLPFGISRLALKKTKYHPKFRSSVMFGISAISSFLMYLLLCLSLIFIDFKFLLLLPIFPRLAYVSALWWDQLQVRRARLQVKLWKRRAPELTETILNNREILLLQSGITMRSGKI